jgi:undecaprenyl-diphosphatase
MTGAEKLRSRTACQVVSIAIFALIATAVAFGLTDALDAAARAAINSLATPALTTRAVAQSVVGSVKILSLLIAGSALALVLRRQPRQALLLVAVFLASVLVNEAVKAMFLRARPETFFGVLPTSYSFASGHALMSTCAFGLLAGLAAPMLRSEHARIAVWVLAILLIAAIGWSRVYLGVHHLTDVLAGFALGAFILCAGRALATEPD